MRILRPGRRRPPAGSSAATPPLIPRRRGLMVRPSKTSHGPDLLRLEMRGGGPSCCRRSPERLAPSKGGDHVGVGRRSVLSPPWQRIRWRKLTPPSSSGSSRFHAASVLQAPRRALGGASFVAGRCSSSSSSSIAATAAAYGEDSLSCDALLANPATPLVVPAIGIILFALWVFFLPLVKDIRNRFDHGGNWKKSPTYLIYTSYLQPLLLWTGATLICRGLDPVVLPSAASQVVKTRLLTFVRSLSTVLATAYILTRCK
ncbi:hypothetical protein ZWY2020_017552 [Hordeum vulgare]|nr:hypothetical protein ZWY2020_017552 [Hordeum vulgare]